MRTVLTLQKFVKEIGFSRANEKSFREHFNYLLRIKAVELQRSGFLSDSMHHHKIVVIRDFEALQRHFQETVGIAQQEPEIEKVPEPHLERQTIAMENVKAEKNIEYCTIGKFGRTFYMELNLEIIRRHDIEKGDIIKAKILELRKAPRPDEPVIDRGEL